MSSGPKYKTAPLRILITGGTGFIGSQLSKSFSRDGHRVTVLSRKPDAVPTRCGEGVAGWGSLDEWSPSLHFDAVINLAGAPIFGGRWSEARKLELWQSRVTLTERLIQYLARAERRPSVLISGSAIGIYGDRGDELLDEETPSKPGGFGQRLCEAWEQAAAPARELGVRLCILRTGLVIGHDGGFLGRMLLPFRLGLGGPIGDGHQWMSWIHLEDHVALTRFLLSSPDQAGIFNATAPNPVTNNEFTTTLAALLRRPARLRMPATVLRLGLGEMSELLLASQRVLPKRASRAKFSFRFETVSAALSNVLRSS